MKKTQNLQLDLPDAEEKAELQEPAEDLNIEEALEAILFAAGHAVTYGQLASLFELSPLEMKALVLEYANKYNHSRLSRGVMLLTYDESCQLCTKPDFLPYIRAALGIRKSGNLSNSSIETLAVIAYNQPVTRSYIDQVRKVDSAYAVNNLLERGLIESKGRLDAPGRPTLLGTTPDFLRCFGLTSLADLPDIHAENAAEVLQSIGQQYMMETDDSGQLSLDDELKKEAVEKAAAPEETTPTEETAEQISI